MYPDIYTARFWFVKGYFFMDNSNVLIGKNNFHNSMIDFFVHLDNFFSFLTFIIFNYKKNGFEIEIYNKVEDINLIRKLYLQKKSMFDGHDREYVK